MVFKYHWHKVKKNSYLEIQIDIILNVFLKACYKDITDEFKSRNIRICAYANLNDRRKVHSEGFDRVNDKSQVTENTFNWYN